ncbi:MAG TPA: hypothetical protein PLP94_07920 [Candidatus Saccharicenans sp.]|nr:hypothetical protein [Candidatus Saccharicenans sp.]
MVKRTPEITIVVKDIVFNSALLILFVRFDINIIVALVHEKQ